MTWQLGGQRRMENSRQPEPKTAFDKLKLCVYIHTMLQQLDMSSEQNCTCFNVRRVARVITQFFDAEVGRQGLRPTQPPILRALQAKDGWTMAELSEWLAMERTTLLRNLRPLQRDGLVRARGGGRGGHVELFITEKGRGSLARRFPAWLSAQNKVVATLGKERWSRIIRDLDEVAVKLKNQ